MKNNNQKTLRKTKRLKNLSLFSILWLDKLNLLNFFVPVVNSFIKLSGIKKKFNSTMNYRIYANSFKDAFRENINEKQKRNAVIFFAMGSESSYFLRQLMIAKYLELNNWNVEIIVCSGFISACHKERIGKSKENSKLMCQECSWGYNYISKKTGMKISELSLNKYPENSTSEKINLKTIEECINYKSNQDIPIGELSKINVLRYFYQGSFYNTEEELKVFNKYLNATQKSVDTLNSYFSEKKKDLIILMNGSGNFDQSVIYFSKKYKIPFITQESFIGSNSWIYKKNGIAIHLDFYKDWQREKTDLNENQIQEITDFFEKLKSGALYSTKLQESNIEKLNLKKGVVLFTNMNFDTYVLGRNSLFTSMENWLEETITFWKNNVQGIPLYIRVHPGESKMLTPTLKFTRDIVKPHLCENIILIDSDSKINSYSILMNANYVITYSSTIGVEAMMMNIPCVSAGEAFYKPFALAPEEKSSYFESLKKMNADSNYFKIEKRNLISYLHYLYFKRIKHFKGFDINRETGNIELTDLDNYKNLIELNKEILDSFYKDCIENEFIS